MTTSAGIAVAMAASAPAAAAPGPVTPAPVTSLVPGQTLRTGDQLRSPDSRYLLTVHSGGELTITGRGRTPWHTSARGTSPTLELAADGNLAVHSHGHLVWQTGTRGVAKPRLELTDAGVLTLFGPGGTAWSDILGNGCGHSTGAHHVTVDISRQQARLCAHHQQILVTPVTTGASDKSDATPTGTWHVYAKVRDTVLYPASGGAYPVRYWMPYNGAYGMHDSPWQHFAYGSSLYRTRGSHGCVHFPGAAMTRLFAWAPVGTTVTIHR